MAARILLARCAVVFAAAALLGAQTYSIASAQGAGAPSGPDHPWAVPAPADEVLDYHLLSNGTFDNFDIVRAKAYRLSDWETAAVLKIAQESDRSYASVLSMVTSGKPLSEVAVDLGVSWSGLRSEQKQEDEIAAYQSAYAATGLNSLPKPYVLPGASQPAK